MSEDAAPVVRRDEDLQGRGHGSGSQGIAPSSSVTRASTPRALRRAAGAEGEAIACGHLRGLRWRIVAQNVYYKGGELDVVALDGDVLVFVEVRSRRTRSGASAAESVIWRKQRHVVRSAQRWRFEHPGHRWRQCRFDVITVDLGLGRVQSHLRGAFEEPPDRGSY